MSVSEYAEARLPLVGGGPSFVVSSPALGHHRSLASAGCDRAPRNVRFFGAGGSVLSVRPAGASLRTRGFLCGLEWCPYAAWSIRLGGRYHFDRDRLMRSPVPRRVRGLSGREEQESAHSGLRTQAALTHARVGAVDCVRGRGGRRLRGAGWRQCTTLDVCS